MSEVMTLHRVYDLPWVTGREQDLKYRRIVQRSVGGLLLASLLLNVIPLPERDPAAVQEIPTRFARLVLERQEPPPPPIVVPEETVPEPEPAPEQAIVEPQVPEIIQEPLPDPDPDPELELVDTIQVARERASVAGLLPFAADLASLRDNEALDNLADTEIVGAAESVAPTTDRSLITSAAAGTSGGIDTESFSRDTGGGGLAARTTTQIENPLEGIGPAGGGASRAGSSNRASRSREEIELVFDRNKGAIFALYNRALRQNPVLVGKLVLNLTIEPNGTVSFCEVVSSELGDPELERKLVQRVLLFQFEEKDVEPMTTTKPIDFFPA